MDSTFRVTQNAVMYVEKQSFSVSFQYDKMYDYGTRDEVHELQISYMVSESDCEIEFDGNMRYACRKRSISKQSGADG